MTLILPRNVRNNNPGNIDKGAPWRFLMPVANMNPAQEAEHRFCVFETPAAGFRALRLLLTNYYADGLHTVRHAIYHWAPAGPPDFNNAVAYAEDVAKFMHVDPDAATDYTQHALMSDMIQGITMHETAGGPPQGWDPYWKVADLEASFAM